jgi:alcohol dehydrogenase (cytochrome c)
LWEVQIGDIDGGFNITSPPLIVKDKISSDTPAPNMRYAATSTRMTNGKRLWRFYTIPAAGEPGSESWKGDSYKTGGGSTWLTGTYDPELNTVYWPIANPAAMTDRSVRGDGDNLYTDCVVALDPDTGKMKWYYQFTPNDGHDWDSTQDMMLVDRMWHGQNRKLLLHADRNGHFYVLDRTTGAFLQGTPFIYQNWNAGFDAKGRPMQVPGSNSSPEGSFFVYPTASGGTNWQSPSYSPQTGFFYLEYSENGAQYVSAPMDPSRAASIWDAVEPGRPRCGSPTSRRRTSASRRSMSRPVRPRGTSSCTRGRRRTA